MKAPDYSNVLIPENPLLVQPTLANLFGVNAAIILQQMYYWINRSSKYHRDINGVERQWIYNKYKDWQKQFTWLSESAIKKNIRKLEKEGVVIPGNFNDRYVDRTKWYALDIDRLYEILNSNRLSASDRNRLRKNQGEARAFYQKADDIDEEEEY